MRRHVERAIGPAVLAVIAVLFFVPMAFLMWIMVRAQKASIQQMRAETARLDPRRRRVYWAFAAACPACIIVGGAVGAAISPAGKALDYCFAGFVLGIGVYLASAIPILLYLRSPGGQSPRK
jgi:uncharacterized membrane protein